MKQISTIVIAALMVTACGSLWPKGPAAPRLYALNAVIAPAASPAAKQTNMLPYSLKILKPHAAPGLETERIALRKDRNSIDYYADARWAADPTVMVQATLVESFEAANRLQSVSNDLIALKSDYDLLIELRDFQTEYKGTQLSGAHVRLTAKLIDTASEEIVKTYRYNRFEPVTDGAGLDAIVAAFDRAQQIVARTAVTDMMAALDALPVPVVPAQK